MSYSSHIYYKCCRSTQF